MVQREVADRLLPRLVAVARLRAPRLARRGVELAVTPVAEGAVAFEAAATEAGQQATEEFDPRGTLRPVAPEMDPDFRWSTSDLEAIDGYRAWHRTFAPGSGLFG